MTIAQLVSWIVSSSLFASGGHRALPKTFADELAKQIDAKPLFSGTSGVQQDAALMNALAWMEGGNVPDVVGDCKGMAPGSTKCDVAHDPQSWCVFQIYLPSGSKTAEGWTGPDLIADPAKCITVARRLVRASITSAENRGGACPLCVYARGRWTPEGQRLSDNRMNLAKKLIREITVGSE